MKTRRGMRSPSLYPQTASCSSTQRSKLGASARSMLVSPTAPAACLGGYTSSAGPSRFAGHAVVAAALASSPKRVPAASGFSSRESRRIPAGNRLHSRRSGCGTSRSRREGGLGIDLEVPGEVDRGEQEIAELFLDAPRASTAPDGLVRISCPKLVDSPPRAFEEALPASGQSKPDLGGAGPDLAGLQHGRHGAGDRRRARTDTVPLARAAPDAHLPSPRLICSQFRRTAAASVASASDRLGPRREDVRMAADQLGAQAPALHPQMVK